MSISKNFKLLILSITSLYYLSCQKPLIDSKSYLPPQTEGSSYEKDWREIALLQEKGLTRDILLKLDSLLTVAENENNPVQLVKILAHQSKYLSQIEEDALVSIFRNYEERAKTTDFPYKQIFHSALAEIYQWYYQQNLWRFSNRSKTVEYEEENILSWDQQTIVANIFEHYDSSLTEAEKLKKVPISLFNEIIVDPKGKFAEYENEIRPSLYDFLAHRALDFYRTAEAEILFFHNNFKIDEETYQTFENFIHLDLKGPFPYSSKWKSLNLYQKLLKFHHANSNETALLHIDLQRLKFLREHYNIANDDSLYISSLNELKKTARKNPVYAEINHSIAEYHFQISNSKAESEGKAAARVKAHEIAKQNLSEFPASFGGHQSKSLLQQIEEKHLGFKSLETSPIKEWSLISIEHKSIATAYLKIIKSPFEQFSFNNLEPEEKAKLIKDLPALFTDSIKLEENSDFLQHETIYPVPELPQGKYIILVSDHPAFSYEKSLLSFEQIQISNISYIRRSFDNSIEIRALDRRSGNPLKNLKVEAWERKYDPSRRKYSYIKTGSKYTDYAGHAIFESEKKSGNQAFLFTNGSDSLFSDGFYPIIDGKKEAESIKTSYFFTDRAIYRPGQTIQFKIITVEEKGKEKKVVPGLTTNIKLWDVNGSEISSLSLTSNDYGSASGFFILPKSSLPGNFRISNEFGSHFFSVEEYKRPTFHIKIDSIPVAYELNSDIPVSGTVQTYTGLPVSGAEIQYTVARNNFYPFPYYSRTSFPRGSGETILIGKAKADSMGRFNFEFTAIAPEGETEFQSIANYRYSISISATADNGETQSNSMDIAIGEIPFYLSTDVPDHLNVDSLKKLQIIARNHNGTLIEKNLHVILAQLKTPEKLVLPIPFENADQNLMDSVEFKRKFPQLSYSDEDKMKNWKTMNNVIDMHTISNQAIALPQLDPGAYVLKAIAVGATGDTVTMEKYFSLFSTMHKNISVPNSFIFFSLEDEVEVGESAKFVLGSSFEGANIYIDLEVDGEIIESRSYLLNSEKKVISWPIKERYRGGFSVHASMVRQNRSFSHTETVYVPYKNKKLNIELVPQTVDLKPGDEEEWTIRVSDAEGNKIESELMVNLYDASLDQFKANHWEFDLYKRNYPRLAWDVSASFHIDYSTGFSKKRQFFIERPEHDFPYLNWFGFHINPYLRYTATEVLAEDATSSQRSNFSSVGNKESAETLPDINNTKSSDHVPIRNDFRETAFFLPAIRMNDSGNYVLNFTVPDALTEWKFMAIAHTKDLKYARLERKMLSKKKLMLYPNMPRSLRQGDSILLSTRIMNNSDEAIQGKIEMEFLNPLNNDSILGILNNDSAIKSFQLSKNQSKVVSWKVIIPEEIDALKYRVFAESEHFTDGEEKIIPVLSNRILVTESMQMAIRESGSRYFQMEKLKQLAKSANIEHHKLTLEFTSDPLWLVVQALPLLLDNEMENSEKTFSRFFANAISTYIVKRNPSIQEVFEMWKNLEPEALQSELKKNEELKSMLLEETPWLLDAKKETERKQKLAFLFDRNRMDYELQNALRELKSMQLSNGGWPWFPNGPDDRYMSQYILSGFGQLIKNGIWQVDHDYQTVLEKAVKYIDQRAYEDYAKSVGDSSKILTPILVHYLYTRSFFPNVEMAKKNEQVFNLLLDRIGDKWQDQGLQAKAMIALTLHRNGKSDLSSVIVQSLNQSAVIDDERGMYWKDNVYGLYWYSSAVETQSLLIRAFTEMNADPKSIEAMKLWLLKQKQTNSWGNSKATAQACYALLSNNSKLYVENQQDVQIEVGNKKINLTEIENESATGYFKKTWLKKEIKSNMANVKIVKQSNDISWGALHWQYFSKISHIDQSASPLGIKKDLFIEKGTKNGRALVPINQTNKVEVGDKIIVRIVLDVDQQMEYVHMKDMRASGLEPVETISQYKFQDGLSYYQSTKDASTNFFFNTLPKGTFVFEYALRASNAGKFPNGITSIQCMYAPEFNSHTQSEVIEISSKD